MVLRQLLNMLKLVRDFLFSTFNKEFLIFLFFLVLSASYWLMSVLNDTMECEVAVRVQLTEVPKNVIILGEENAKVTVVLRDKGYTVATYIYGDKLKAIHIPFSTYARGNFSCYITSTELMKLISKDVYASTKIVSVKPDKIEFRYNHGLRKRVPVRLYGQVRPGENYYLSQVSFQPESVTVYSTQEKLDSIREAYTQHQKILNFTDTLQRRVELRPLPGVKFVPKTVIMRLYPDIMTEAVAMVPVTSINVPEGYTLRTFPATVQVRYVVGASQYKQIDTQSFCVVADYDSTDGGLTEKCTLRLLKAPREARNAVIVTPQVDYLIEQ